MEFLGGVGFGLFIAFLIWLVNKDIEANDKSIEDEAELRRRIDRVGK